MRRILFVVVALFGVSLLFIDTENPEYAARSSFGILVCMLSLVGGVSGYKAEVVHRIGFGCIALSSVITGIFFVPEMTFNSEWPYVTVLIISLVGLMDYKELVAFLLPQSRLASFIVFVTGVIVVIVSVVRHDDFWWTIFGAALVIFGGWGAFRRLEWQKKRKPNSNQQ